MDVFVTQCAEMIFLHHFTPVCLLLVEIKFLLDGSKVNLIAVKYRNTDRELPLCLKTQLCRLVTLSMKPSPSFLRSPGDSWLVKIKPAKFAATDPRWWIVDAVQTELFGRAIYLSGPSWQSHNTLYRKDKWFIQKFMWRKASMNWQHFLK